MVLIAVAAICGMLFSQMQATAAESTLDTVKKRGYLNCIIGNSFSGFYTVDEKGKWSGMDIDICRSVAAAVFGDKDKVKFKSVQWAQSFTSIKSGAGDLLSKGMTWTLSRDTSQGLDFLDTYFYDGQGFMVRKDLGIKSAMELKGATVCVLTGTSSELNLTDFNRTNNLNLKPVVFDDSAVRNAAFFNNNCDCITNDRSGLAAARSAADNPDDYVVFAGDHFQRGPLFCRSPKRQFMGQCGQVDLCGIARSRRVGYHVREYRQDSQHHKKPYHQTVSGS